MAQRQAISPATLQKARKANALGLQQYERWEIEGAIEAFQDAIRIHAKEPEKSGQIVGEKVKVLEKTQKTQIDRYRAGKQ